MQHIGKNRIGFQPVCVSLHGNGRIDIGTMQTCQSDGCFWMAGHQVANARRIELNARQNRIGYKLFNCLDSSLLCVSGEAIDIQVQSLRDSKEQSPSHDTFVVLNKVQITRRHSNRARKVGLRYFERQPPSPNLNPDRRPHFSPDLHAATVNL